jgi:TolB protein
MRKLIWLFFASILLMGCGSSKPVVKQSRETPSTTGNAQSLIRITSDPAPEFYPNVSPDGKKLVFHIRDDSKTKNISSSLMGSTERHRKWSIMLINLGQPGRTPLVGEFTLTPSFFPDSKTIIYAYLKPTNPIIAKSQIDGLSGINYVSANNMGDFDNNPSVSPDGKRIAFSTTFGGTSQVCVMDVNGMNTTILTEGSRPSWSPSNKLTYYKAVGKYEQIFIYNLQTGQSTQLTQGEFNNADPVFSPDGKYIAFSSTRDNENEQIFAMHEDGSSVVQLTQGSTRNGMPCFGPDNTIFFCSNASSGKKGSIDKLLWQSADIWSIKPILR